MAFIELFVGPISIGDKEVYRAYATTMSAITVRAGASSAKAFWGLGESNPMLGQLASALKAGPDETIAARLVSWASKEARDAGYASMMSNPDPQLVSIKLPFDRARIVYSAFEELGAT